MILNIFNYPLVICALLSEIWIIPLWEALYYDIYRID
jgi:hypothetical protein